MSLFSYTDSMGMSKEKLGDSLRSARKARGLRQTDVAEFLGTSERQVRRWESGRHTPGGLILTRIVQYFRERSERPDLAALDAIIAEEEARALLGESESDEIGELRANALALIEDLAHHPQRLARWIGYGERLLDEHD